MILALLGVVILILVLTAAVSLKVVLVLLAVGLIVAGLEPYASTRLGRRSP